MSKRARPPDNFGLGRQRGIETRKRRSALHDKMIWDAVTAIARWHMPTSLRGYAEELNTLGLRSANGAIWTAQKLSHVFNRHNTTPKKLSFALTAPDVFEEPLPVPKVNREKFRKAIEKLDATSKANGRWFPVIENVPSRAAMVRHPEFGEGQFVAEVGLGKLRCRFIDEKFETFDVVIPANQIEIYQFHLGRTERQEHASALAARWLRPPPQ